MNALRRSLVAVLVTACALLPSGAVSARDEGEARFERRGYEVELGGAGGFYSSPSNDGLNAFGLGFGGRIGVSFSGGLFLGGQVTSFLGNSVGTLSESSLLVGGELGYRGHLADLGDGTLLLRPQLGFGWLNVSRNDPSVDVVTTASGTVSGSGTSAGAFYLEPRLMLVYGLGGFFVAGGAGALLVPRMQYGDVDPVFWKSFGGRLEIGLRL